MTQSRRQFGKNLLASATALTAAANGPFGRRSEAAQDNAADPRFLINIHTRGGHDSFWWHNYCRKDDYASYLNANGEPASKLDTAYTDRFDPSLAVNHPFVPAHTMGLGMSIFDRDDWSRMALVKGLVPSGGHDIGNRIINCGLFSNYSASFSALISADLATKSLPLPLHYVQISGSAAELYSWPGLLGGYAVGVNLPNPAAFQSLTQFLPGEFDAGRRDLLGKSLLKLAGQTASSGFRLAQSKTFYDAFVNSFNAMTKVYGTNLAQSPAFGNTIDAYKTAASAALTTLNSRYGALNASLPSAELVARVAFAFAMGEFLLVQGLTRVIDIGPVDCNWDGHAQNDYEFSLSLVKYSMFQALMRRLKAVPCPGTLGKSYMDQTTIVMTSEFDRTAALSVGAAGQTKGTNHGDTASFLIAGRGVRGGQVLGDFKTAPGAYGKFSAFPNVGAFGALPVNAQGIPTPGGQYLTTKCIFPTLMEMFRTSIPAQQQTEGFPIMSVIA